MIYLTTGANGAGKTLITLKDVREQQLKESRPVYYHGFEAGDVLIGWGWLSFDPEKWQDLPDGSICIFDECQNEFPAKITGAIPDFINAIAQFRRKRGFDFWLITPHPSLIHINVRRLIENPSWHRHIKRTFGSDMCSVLKFNAPNMNCEKPSAGSSGTVTMRAFPKEVYSWYKSAQLHTGKKTIPKQIYVLVLCAVLVPLMGWFAFNRLMNHAPGSASAAAAASKTSTFAVSPGRQGSQDKSPMTAAEYGASFTPRIEGFPSSASRYDALSAPTQAPKPAACIEGKRPGQKSVVCDCWTQQATKLNIPDSMCRQIARGGWFDDTLQAANIKSDGVAPLSDKTSQNVFSGAGVSAISSSPLLEPPDVRSTVSRDAEVLAFMRKRETFK